MRKNRRNQSTVKEVWMCDPNYHKIRWTFALNFSNRSYINHLIECFSRYPNTSKLVKKNSPADRSFNPLLNVRISDNTLPRVWYITSNRSLKSSDTKDEQLIESFSCFHANVITFFFKETVCLCLVHPSKRRLFNNRRKVEYKMNYYCYVMFNIRAGVFYRGIKPRGEADKIRPASLLNGFKNILQKACLFWVQGSNCEGKILAYKKNKKCLISILFIKNINEECYRVRLKHVTFYRCFDRLLGSWIINEFVEKNVL